MTGLIDTHCHIHEASLDVTGDALVREKWATAGFTDPSTLIDEATKAGVTKLICVGCTLKDSELAVKLAQRKPNCYASVGVHPHEVKDHLSSKARQALAELVGSDSKIVAVGEIGLDYYYEHSPRLQQIEYLKFQLELAKKQNLPVIFHVREAWDDFWPIFDQFKAIRGVIHSFSANTAILEQILKRDLYVGLNGIMTFTKDGNQIEAAKKLPLNRLMLETDAPFLTPAPYRGTICQPKHVVETAKFLSKLRNEPLEDLAQATSANARKLFNF